MPKPTSASFELFCRRSDLRGELGDFFLSFSSIFLIYIWRFSINNNDYWCWILCLKWFSTIIWGVILKSAPPISVPFNKIYWKKKDECGRVKMNDLIMTIHYWTGCKAAICVFFILIMCCLTTAVDISIAGNMILA